MEEDTEVLTDCKAKLPNISKQNQGSTLTHVSHVSAEICGQLSAYGYLFQALKSVSFAELIMSHQSTDYSS